MISPLSCVPLRQQYRHVITHRRCVGEPKRQAGGSEGEKHLKQVLRREQALLRMTRHGEKAITKTEAKLYTGMRGRMGCMRRGPSLLGRISSTGTSAKAQAEEPACWVKRMIGTWGMICLSWRAACRPSRTGMETSRTMRSGRH